MFIYLLFVNLIGTAYLLQNPNFNNYYSTCEYIVDNNVHFIFPNQIEKVQSPDGKTKIYFSFCKNNDGSAMAWLETQDNSKKSLGKQLEITEKNATFSIGDYCTKESHYNLTIHFECSESTPTAPQWHSSTACSYHVTAMHPICEPKCTFRVQRIFLLDFRTLNQPLFIPGTETNYSINLCGPNPQCGPTNSACKLTNNVPIGKTASQTFYYDTNRNELTAKSNVQTERTKKIIEHTEMVIKCNWDAVEPSNLQHVQFQTQTHRYKFTMDSILACVQVPNNCRATSLDNYNYDLVRLARNDAWQVKDTANDAIIHLNVCGPLKHQGGNNCGRQNAQVCRWKSGKAVNLGSIMRPLKVTDEEILQLVFVSGENYNETVEYKTLINFECNRIEQGPQLQSSKDFLTVIQWKTPEACPKNVYEGDKCMVHDRFGLKRNLQPIYNRTDYVLQISETERVVYNLCGAISEPCSNVTGNVSICLKTENRADKVIAWENDKVVSENGLLKMEMNGGVCTERNNQQNFIAFVDFTCSYEQGAQIAFSGNNCRYNVTYPTPHACISENQFENCQIITESHLYDLSPLIRRNSNHIVNGTNGTMISLNVCGPIVNNFDAMCKQNTMICMNTHNVNVKHKFYSLGGVNRLKLNGSDLMIESKMGARCWEDFTYYHSVIYFKCSESETGPKLIKTDKCMYTFEWHTPHACAKQKGCFVENKKHGERFDLKELDVKSFKINIDNHTHDYEFNVCDNAYKQTGGKSDLFLERNFYVLNNVKFIQFDLNKTKCDKSILSKVTLELVCSLAKPNSYEEKAFENCNLHIILRSHLVCDDTQKQIGVYKAVTTEESVEKVTDRVEVTSIVCIIPIEENVRYLNLTNIKNRTVFLNGNYYSLNFNGRDSNCHGLICKNNRNILSASNCPLIQHNKTMISLNYTSMVKCKQNDVYRLRMYLECDLEEKVDLIETGACSLLILYKNSTFCPTVEHSTHLSIIIECIVAAIVLVVGFVVLFLILHQKGYLQRFSYRALNRNKQTTQIYMRDTTF